MELNDEMKALLKDLGMALHHALTKDDQIQNITDKIKGNGYDIYLIMEANIALDRREDNDKGRLFLHRPEDHLEAEDIKLNPFDEKFLLDLKIKVEDE